MPRHSNPWLVLVTVAWCYMCRSFSPKVEWKLPRLNYRVSYLRRMELRKACVGYLSNYEVLDILQGTKSNKQHRKPHNQLATITYQTIRYLEDTPCKKHTPATIAGFMKAVETFKLTKCEKLTLLNLCPTTALEIQLVIEDSEERLTEEEVNSLLQVISFHLTDDKTDEGTETEEIE